MTTFPDVFKTTDIFAETVEYRYLNLITGCRAGNNQVRRFVSQFLKYRLIDGGGL
jgi:hypothetical protein